VKFVYVETGTCSRCGRDLDGEDALVTGEGKVSCLGCMTRAENIAQGERLAQAMLDEYQVALRAVVPDWETMRDEEKDRALNEIAERDAERLDEIIDLLGAVHDTVDELKAERDPRSEA